MFTMEYSTQSSTAASHNCLTTAASTTADLSQLTAAGLELPGLRAHRCQTVPLLQCPTEPPQCPTGPLQRETFTAREYLSTAHPDLSTARLNRPLLPLPLQPSDPGPVTKRPPLLHDDSSSKAGAPSSSPNHNVLMTHHPL